MSGVSSSRYQRIALLGRGGMAEVWKAKLRGPAGFERTVVVKRILPLRAGDHRFVQMFLSEARLSARLAHPNIVQVFELSDEGSEYFMVMEWVDGNDITKIVQAMLPRGAMPVGFGTLVVRDICRALGYAHALRDESGRSLHIVHRDVSPSNVMVTYDGLVKLLDFGIAKALGVAAQEGEARTESGAIKGKMGYLSPEMIDGKPVDHRADLFAAGTILHELLTGRRLFRGATDFETLTMLREAKVVAPSTINPAVSPELDAICLRALARDPDARFATGDEMADALEAHLAGWNGARLRALQTELFPEGLRAAPTPPSESDGEPPPAATQALTPSARSAERRGERAGGFPLSNGASVSDPSGPARRNSLRGWIVGSALVAVVVVGGVVLWRGGRAVPVAPAASSAQPLAPVTPSTPDTTAISPAAAPANTVSVTAPAAVPSPRVEAPAASHPRPRLRGKARVPKSFDPEAGLPL